VALDCKNRISFARQIVTTLVGQLKIMPKSANSLSINYYLCLLWHSHNEDVKNTRVGSGNHLHFSARVSHEQNPPFVARSNFFYTTPTNCQTLIFQMKRLSESFFLVISPEDLKTICQLARNCTQI
jgi:hypothetical protein